MSDPASAHVGGLRIAYERGGKGPTTVLLDSGFADHGDEVDGR